MAVAMAIPGQRTSSRRPMAADRPHGLRRRINARLAHVSDLLALAVVVLAVGVAIIGWYAHSQHATVTKQQGQIVQQGQQIARTNGALGILQQEHRDDQATQLSLQRQIDRLSAEIGQPSR